MARRWRVHPHDPDRVASLSRAAGVPAIVAQLLICRGIFDPLLVREFLDAKLSGLRDPELLPGVSQAAPRIYDAITAGRRIIVYGDYDVDGISGTSLLLECFRLLGGNAGYYVPDRMEEGYGLNCDALQRLASQGAEMVVTVDCGIASLEEADEARRLGLELIITDHHEMRDRLPDAAAIVHPRLPRSNYPFTGLSGAGVAFKLAWAVATGPSQAKQVSPQMRDFLLRAVALASLGTVADVVPLVDENRILVRHGLTCLRHNPTLGVSQLMKVAGLEGRRELTSEDIGFCLAPRLNAAGRLGQARLAVELLTTESPTRAAELAEYIDELNKSRQSLERSIQLAAAKQIKQQFDPENDAALVLADANWHPGVIGIVAGRLAEKYHRPVVLVALDKLGAKPGVGSARSVPGFNLHQALAACSEHLLSHGGHAAAAGLKIDPVNLDRFRADFCEYAAGEISHEERVAELWIDAEAPLASFTMQAVEQIENLAPFGQGNSRPLLCTSDVRLLEPPRRIGNGERHLSMKVVQHGVAMRAVAFGQSDRAEELLDTARPLSIAFRPIINSFRGRRSVELHIADWQV